MFCRICGNEIPDDSIFCLKCGNKVINKPIKTEESVEQRAPQNPITSENNEEPYSEKGILDIETPYEYKDSNVDVEAIVKEERKKKKPNYMGIFFIILSIVAIIGLLIWAKIADENKKKQCIVEGCYEEKQYGSSYCVKHSCSFTSCKKMRVEGSIYCTEHKCKEAGCVEEGSFEGYCSTHYAEHKCAIDYCDNMKMAGYDYCEYHKCLETGCNNASGSFKAYCTEHAIDFDKEFPHTIKFTRDSAGGISVQLQGTNKTKKEIKYIRFKIELFNSVDDQLKDDIKRQTTWDVELLGPVASNKKMNLYEDICYCDKCSKVSVKDFVIIFSDGTRKYDSKQHKLLEIRKSYTFK